MSSITLFSTLAVRKAFEDSILESFTEATGITVDAVFDPTVQLVRRVAAGEPFDLMIGVIDSFDAIGDRVDLGTRTPVGRTGLGLGVAPTAAKPDISTLESFTRVVVDARSVGYSRTGASGIYFAELIGRLGIADAVDERATIIEKGFTGELLLDGRADVAIQQLSELAFVPGVEIAGPFPAEIQRYTDFAVALSATPGSPEEAGAFVAYVSGAPARDALRASGVDPA